MYQTSSCHILLFSSSPLPHPAPPCTCHILPLCESCSIALPHGRICIYFLLLPPTGIPHASFWRVQVTKQQFHRFHEVHWAVQILFIPISTLNPPYISLKLSSYFTSFLSASLSILSIRYFTSVLRPPTWTASLLASLLHPSMFSSLRYIPHLPPAHSFVTYSPSTLSAMAGNLFDWHALFLSGLRTVQKRGVSAELTHDGRWQGRTTEFSTSSIDGE